ncbi:hypothetical protein ACLB2K_028362 [Fragaria x ananassa]
MQREIPVHTFGFGNDHDASIMHAISDASGGTFSYTESVGMIQDSFALCIGGLLSVVAQELRLTVRSASSGVKIESIPSGRHVSQISDEGRCRCWKYVCRRGEAISGVPLSPTILSFRD